MGEWILLLAGAVTIVWLIERFYGFDNFFKKIVWFFENSWEFIKGVFIK